MHLLLGGSLGIYQTTCKKKKKKTSIIWDYVYVCENLALICPLSVSPLITGIVIRMFKYLCKPLILKETSDMQSVSSFPIVWLLH